MLCLWRGRGKFINGRSCLVLSQGERVLIIEMVKKFYLTSGHSSRGELADIDGRALGEAGNGNVLVLNMSSDDAVKTEDKRDYLRQYFRGLWDGGIIVLDSDSSDEDVDRGFGRANLVYLPGGNTKVLLRNLRDRGLRRRLEGFEGIILGNSAGAYALCPEYLRVGHGPTEIIPSLGLVDFWVKAHYNPEFDGELKRLSEQKKIYALEDVSAVVFSRDGWDKTFDYVGDVWKFFDGKKERCYFGE